MEHSYFKDRISAFYDNELKHEEKQLIAEHLQDCVECQELLDDLQKFDQVVQRHSGLADDEYWEKSAQRIESAIGSEAPVEIAEVKRSPIRGLGWKLAAAAASIALLTSIAMHQIDLADWLGKDTHDELRVVGKVEPPPSDQVVDEEPATQTDERLSEGYAPAPAIPEKAEDRGVAGIDVTQDTSLRQAPVEYKPSNEIQPKVGIPKRLADKEVTDTGAADYYPSKELAPLPEPRYESPTVPKADSVARIQMLSEGSVEALPERESTEATQQSPKSVDDHLGNGTLLERMLEDAEDVGGTALADTAPVDTQVIVQQWRSTRDSLETIVTALDGVETSGSAKDKKAAVAAYNRAVMQAIVDSVSPQVAEHDPQLKLLEAYYQIARWTGRGGEYERSVKYLKDYLKLEDAPFKLHAAWYLQQLEQAD